MSTRSEILSIADEINESMDLHVSVGREDFLRYMKEYTFKCFNSKFYCTKYETDYIKDIVSKTIDDNF